MCVSGTRVPETLNTSVRVSVAPKTQALPAGRRLPALRDQV